MKRLIDSISPCPLFPTSLVPRAEEGKRSGEMARRGRCLLAALPLLAGCGREIPPAQVGIKFSAMSGISEQLLKPQVVWVLPRQRLILYPTNIRNATYTRGGHGAAERSGGNDSIQASTVEGAILPTDVTISYHVDPANVLKVYQNFGTNDIQQIQIDFIRPTANWAVNCISGQKSVFELTSKERAQFGQRVKALITPKLASWGITVDDVFTGEVYPPDAVKQKVNDRISVRTELDTAQVALKRARVEAETVQTKAKEQAEVNRLLSAAGDKVISLRKIELRRKAIAKWDGTSPLTGDGRIPFTDINMGR